MTPFSNNESAHSVSIMTTRKAGELTGMEATEAPMRVLTNYIYEYKKGVRRMVLYTFNKRYER